MKATESECSVIAQNLLGIENLRVKDNNIRNQT